MTFEELEKYFGNGAKIGRALDTSTQNAYLYKKNKHVPLCAQKKAYIASNGYLKIDRKYYIPPEWFKPE